MTFYTDVLMKDPRFTSTDRISDLGMLEPVTRAAVLAIIADAAAGGRTLHVTETFRSQQRQWQLYQQGATQLAHVGVHGYGLAADFVLIGPSGAADWTGQDYAFLNYLAAVHGLIWGGDWGDSTVPHSLRDMDHVQRINVADQAGLFAVTWWPADDYRPVIR